MPMHTPDSELSQTEPTNGDTDLPSTRFSRLVDGLLRNLGHISAWLWLFVLAVVVTNVFSRFVLGRGSIALEELSWYLFGAAMMLSLSYAVVTDDHVRVDFLHDKFAPRTKAWIDLVLILTLALPVLYIVLDSTISYAHRSFVTMEASPAPSGLPYRFLIKGMMPVGFALVIVALISRVLRCTALLFGFPRPIWDSPSGAASVEAKPTRSPGDSPDR